MKKKLIKEHPLKDRILEIEVVTKDEFDKFEKSNLIKKEISSVFGDSCEYYLLKDSRIVIKLREDIAIFQSLEEVYLFYEDVKKAKNILSFRNPFGEEFPSHVDELIDELLSFLDIEQGQTITKEFVKQVEKTITINKINFIELEKYLLHFIALVGKASINKTGSSWLMDLAEDGETWYPNLFWRNSKWDICVHIFEIIFIDKNFKNKSFTDVIMYI